MKKFHLQIVNIDDEALDFILKKTKGGKVFDFSGLEQTITIFLKYSGEAVNINLLKVDENGVTGYCEELGEEIFVSHYRREQHPDGNLAWIADLVDGLAQ